jgi:hypothetical protein
MTESDDLIPADTPLTETEEFIVRCGVPMIEIFFIDRRGQMTSENHVNDPFTLAETIAMSMDRTGAHWAVYPDGEFWALTGKGKTRHYQSKEAAEMVAIHRG